MIGNYIRTLHILNGDAAFLADMHYLHAATGLFVRSAVGINSHRKTLSLIPLLHGVDFSAVSDCLTCIERVRHVVGVWAQVSIESNTLLYGARDLDEEELSFQRRAGALCQRCDIAPTIFLANPMRLREAGSWPVRSARSCFYNSQVVCICALAVGYLLHIFCTCAFTFEPE
jgi:hypothetical protein